VVVGESRRAAGERALAEISPAPELFLLDDGFSHVALARDLELLVFPADDPWAGGRLLPSGRLREPRAAAAAADAAVLTDAPLVAAGAELGRALARYGFRGEGFASTTLAGPPRRLDGEPLGNAARAWAVAAIARPERFFAAARAAGVELAGTSAFRDHHPYSARDRRALAATARAAGAGLLLTTEKDAAKLAGRVELPLAVLPIEARPEPRFWSWLAARLDDLARSR
jgi:tetraacyldisaccharide 4'-kinase